jgi:hypothetical protein
MKWRPIAQAPRNRGNLIVGQRGRDPWFPGDVPEDRVAFAFWLQASHPKEEGAWCVIGGNWRPTHWLDVPIPPIPALGDEPVQASEALLRSPLMQEAMGKPKAPVVTFPVGPQPKREGDDA